MKGIFKEWVEQRVGGELDVDTDMAGRKSIHFDLIGKIRFPAPGSKPPVKGGGKGKAAQKAAKRKSKDEADDSPARKAPWKR